MTAEGSVDFSVEVFQSSDDLHRVCEFRRRKVRSEHCDALIALFCGHSNNEFVQGASDCKQVPRLSISLRKTRFMFCALRFMLHGLQGGTMQYRRVFEDVRQELWDVIHMVKPDQLPQTEDDVQATLQQ